MSMVNDLLRDLPIPRMLPVRQKFDAGRIEDVPAAVRRELDRPDIRAKLRPGMRIAITAGSRGIDNLAIIIKEVAAFLKENGAEPFIIPAMGSHGGSTAEGQLAIIRDYGITPEAMGCPVVATMEVKQIGELDDGRPILINRLAAEADGIVSLNRVKAHTAFRARYESGVMKMLTIGLGCQAGAETCHRQGISRLGENVEAFARGILKHANVIFGVGIVENAYDRTALIRVMPGERIPEEEPNLLLYAKQRMAKIYFDAVDVLVVDYIGKNISGEGMDPNISGRWIVSGIDGGIDAAMIAALDLTEETQGNFYGLGMADTCARRAVEKGDPEKTYPTSLTSTVAKLSKIPMVLDNHKLAIQACIKMVPGKEPDEISMIRIGSTLDMDVIWISETLLEEAKRNPALEILGEPQEMIFDSEGNLF